MDPSRGLGCGSGVRWEGFSSRGCFSPPGPLACGAQLAAAPHAAALLTPPTVPPISPSLPFISAPRPLGLAWAAITVDKAGRLGGRPGVLTTG